MTRLSHSSVSLYMRCSYCYYLKYIENIRPVKIKSAFLFGKAIDDAFNILLLEKDVIKAENHFKRHWSALKNTPIEYRKNESDIELVKHFVGEEVDEGTLPWQTLYYKG